VGLLKPVEFLVNGVCKPIGTGFLLGPSVVITNYHVMKSVITNKVRPEDVVLRFDYKEEANGVKVPEGREYRLATDWWVSDSPVNQLDYALVRLASNAGGEILRDNPGISRGWLTPEEHEFAAGEPLFILQHPEGNPLRVAFDRVERVLQGAKITRVTYRTNTKRGSSGSPCFTINWGLVALHHGFDEDDPDYPNEGIPFAAILDKVQITADHAASTSAPRVH